MLLFWLLEVEVISWLEKMQLLFGVTEINFYNFYGIVQFGGENWRTKDQNYFWGSTFVIFGVKPKILK